MREVTKESLQAMNGRGTLIHRTQNNADGTPVRARLNGKMKTWKTDDDWFQPMKYGLKDCFYIGFTSHGMGRGNYRLDQRPEDWAIAEGEEYEKRA